MVVRRSSEDAASDPDPAGRADAGDLWDTRRLTTSGGRRSSPYSAHASTAWRGGREVSWRRWWWGEGCQRWVMEGAGHKNVTGDTRWWSRGRGSGSPVRRAECAVSRFVEMFQLPFQPRPTLILPTPRLDGGRAKGRRWGLGLGVRVVKAPWLCAQGPRPWPVPTGDGRIPTSLQAAARETRELRALVCI